MTESELTPARFIEQLLAGALAQGRSAASARLFDFREATGSSTFETGSDVKVEITYRQGNVDHTDIVRLDRAWQLVDGGGELSRLACPDAQPPYAFIAAAMVMDSNHVRHDLVVIDRRGGAWSLADTTQVGDSTVADTLRTQVLRHANPAERKRTQKAIDKLNSVSPDTGEAIFAGAAGSHLAEEPERRGLDPGRALLQWSYKTVDRDGTERIIAVSDPTITSEPLGRLSTAGASAVAVDELGRTRADLQGANVWNRPIDPTGDKEPDAGYPSPVYDPVTRKPDDHELKPDPDDTRWQSDPVGDLASLLPRWRVGGGAGCIDARRCGHASARRHRPTPKHGHGRRPRRGGDGRSSSKSQREDPGRDRRSPRQEPAPGQPNLAPSRDENKSWSGRINLGISFPSLSRRQHPMALAILRLDGVDAGVELQTADPMICRAMWRLMSTAVTPQEMAELTGDPEGKPPVHQ